MVLFSYLELKLFHHNTLTILFYNCGIVISSDSQ